MTETLRYSFAVSDQMVDRITAELDPADLFFSRKLSRQASQTVLAVERETQAFFFLDPDHWLGVLDRRNEEIHSFAEPEIENAIDKLASIAGYWSLYVSEWRKGRSGYNLQRSALEISPNGTIDIVHNAEDALYKAQKEKRKGNYPSWILITNWLGDGDFWGSSDQRIFPMKVATGGIPREKFGISADLINTAWENWIQHDQELRNLQHRSAVELWKSRVLPFEANKAIYELLEQGEIVSDYRLASQIIKDWGDSVAPRTYTRIENLLRECVQSKIREEGEDSLALRAASSVATCLTEMTQLAQNSQQRQK